MQARGREALGSRAANATFKFKGLILHEKTHEDSRIGGRQSPPPPALVSAQQKKKKKVRIKTIGLWDTLKKKKISFFCVLMYKGKDQLSTSKSGVLKGGRAVGRPAGASVLCLFPIPWPEAMVCIFRTTAGSGQAGDLSSDFITARRMTHRADGALRSGCASARSRPLRPARSSPRPPPRCPKPEL